MASFFRGISAQIRRLHTLTTVDQKLKLGKTSGAVGSGPTAFEKNPGEFFNPSQPEYINIPVGMERASVDVNLFVQPSVAPNTIYVHFEYQGVVIKEEAVYCATTEGKWVHLKVDAMPVTAGERFNFGARVETGQGFIFDDFDNSIQVTQVNTKLYSSHIDIAQNTTLPAGIDTELLLGKIVGGQNTIGDSLLAKDELNLYDPTKPTRLVIPEGVERVDINSTFRITSNSSADGYSVVKLFLQRGSQVFELMGSDEYNLLSRPWTWMKATCLSLDVQEGDEIYMTARSHLVSGTADGAAHGGQFIQVKATG